MGPGQASSRQPSDELGCSWEVSLGSASHGLRMRHPSLHLSQVTPSLQLQPSPQQQLRETWGRGTGTLGLMAMTARGCRAAPRGAQNRGRGRGRPSLQVFSLGETSPPRAHRRTGLGWDSTPPPDPGTKRSWPALPQLPVLGTQAPSPAGFRSSPEPTRPGAGSVPQLHAEP